MPRPRRPTTLPTTARGEPSDWGRPAPHGEPYLAFESFHEMSRTVDRGTSAVPPLRISKPLAVHLPPEPPKASRNLRPQSPAVNGARRRRRPVAAVQICEPSLVMFRSCPLVGTPDPGSDSEPDVIHTDEELISMSALDKAKNKVEDLGGQAKEAGGKATGDKSTENEGKVDQVKANLKDAGEKVKDAFK